MAIPKLAKVVSTQRIAPDTRLLELISAEPLRFVGGQYVIVDSRLVLPSGKAVKRAYSLLTADRDQHRFELAVKRIPDGPGSGFVHELEAGADLSFSGPWGKFFPTGDASGSTLIFATDTGISAAIGLTQAQRFAPLLSKTVLVWLRVSPNYFLPDEFVRGRIPSACAEVRIASIPAVGDPGRVAHARALLGDILPRVQPQQAFVAGDGAINYALLDDLLAAQVPASRDNLESFFNMPKKSA
jgi:ferredoxin-NADP reductase